MDFFFFVMSMGKQPCHQNINFFFTFSPRVSEDWGDENVNTHRHTHRKQSVCNLFFLPEEVQLSAGGAVSWFDRGRYTSAFSVGQRRVTPARWWMCCNQMMYAHRSPGWIPVPLFKTNGFSHISAHLCKDHSGISTAPLFCGASPAWWMYRSGIINMGPRESVMRPKQMAFAKEERREMAMVWSLAGKNSVYRSSTRPSSWGRLIFDQYHQHLALIKISLTFSGSCPHFKTKIKGSTVPTFSDTERFVHNGL